MQIECLTEDFHGCRFYFLIGCHAIIYRSEHIFINNSVQDIVTARHDIAKLSRRLPSSKNNWTSRRSFSLIGFPWKFWQAACSCFSGPLALLGMGETYRKWVVWSLNNENNNSYSTDRKYLHAEIKKIKIKILNW